MSDAKTCCTFDPKELVPAALGFLLGIGILAIFLALAKVLGLTLLVNNGAIPHQ